jgi:serine protease
MTAIEVGVVALPAPAATGGGLSAFVPRRSHKIVYPTRAARPERRVGRAAAASGSGLLSYGGGIDGIGVTTGPPRVYLVFWGSQWGTQTTGSDGYSHFSGDARGMAPRVQAMLSGLGTNGERWSGVMTQYCEGIAAGATSCPGSAVHVGYPSGGALAGVWYDGSVPAPTNAIDHDLAVVAVSAAGHFNNLTAGTNRNAQYVVVSPSGTHPGGFNTSSGQFCAWHDYNGDSTLVGGAASSPYGDIAFTNLPYIPDMGFSCGANFVNAGTAGALDGVTIVEGHEYAETVTDQNPGGGWLDAIGYENGDKCAWVGTGGTGGAQNVAFGNGAFAMQATFANDANACEISHAIVGAATNDFSISASPSTLSTRQGVSTTTAVNTAVVSGTAESAALSVTGVPAGVTASFGSNSVTAGSSTTLSLTVASTTTPNSYTLTVTGTAVSATHSTTVHLTVTPANDFSIAVSPASLSTKQGVATSTTVNTAVTAGAAASVSLSASGLPAGVAGTFTPGSVTAGSASTLNLTVAASTTPGAYAVSVTGSALSNGATVSHTAVLTLTVTSASGTGIVNGGFETGTLSGWTSAGSTSIGGSAHSGSYAAVVGSGSPTSGDSSITQTFVAGGSVLSFWYNVHCPDTVTYDWATVTLKDNTTGGTRTVLARTCTNGAGWKQVSGVSLTPGHNYTLKLVSHDDNYPGDPTYVQYDDVTAL